MYEPLPAQSLSVLVVDDEEPVRDMLGWMLDDAGYVTHSAPSGHEALAFMRARHQVDLVLSDINMPEMDGIALCKLIEIEFPDVPVLLISGRPRPDGVKSFVAKPFRANVLTREIEQLTSAARTPQASGPQHPH